MNKVIWIMVILSTITFAQGVGSEDSSNDWLVRVRLTNGSILKGVVLSNRFVEKSVYKTMIYQEIEDFRAFGAGIRIWYVRNNPGFIFLPYTEVISVIKQARLSSKARKEIENRIRTKIARVEVAGATAQKQRENRLKKAGIGLTEEEERDRLAKEAKILEEEAQSQLNQEQILQSLPENARTLLEQFPPEQGWNTEFYQRIKPRVLRAKGKRRNKFRGIPVSYRKFVDAYPQWLTAVSLFTQQKNAALKKIKEKLQKAQDKRNKEMREQLSKDDDSTVDQPPQTPQTPEASDTPKKDQVLATSQFKSQDAINDAINKLLYAKNLVDKLQAIETLGKMGKQAHNSCQSLRLALKDPEAQVRRAAIRALAEIKEPKNVVLNALAEALELGDLLMRREAASAFLLLGKDAVRKFDILTSSATLDEDPEVRYRVIRVLEMIGDKRAVTYIQTRLWDADLSVQIATASALLSLVDTPETLDQWIRSPLLKGVAMGKDQVKVLSSECLKRLTKVVKTPQSMLSLREELENVLKTSSGEIHDNIQDGITFLTSNLKNQSPTAEKSSKPINEDNDDEENLDDGEEDSYLDEEDYIDNGEE